jgi:uncharacterized protein YukE
MATVTAAGHLAPFAHEWIGGDIHGLAQLAGTLYGHATQVTDVAAALDAQVRQVVGAAGWEGAAAAAFTAAWQRDSLTARAVGLAADQVAGVIGWLAVTLSQIEAGLERAAAEVSAHGVPVGADGAPPSVCYPSPGGAAQPAAQHWLSGYQVFYTACLRAAQGARELAAGTLAATVRQIIDHASAAGQVVTAADLLGDLLAEPSATVRESAADIADDIAGIREDLARLRSGDGSLGDILDDLDAKVSDLGSANIDLRVAKAEETALTKLADFRVGDVVNKLMNAWRGGGAHVQGGEPDPGGDGELGKTGEFVDEVRDIPVLDVLAAAAGTALGTYQDTHGAHPQSLDVALTEEGLSNVGGLGGAVAIGQVAGEAGGPVGMVVGVLLPDSIHNTLHENWAGDVHQNGWVKGLVIAQGDIGKNNVEDVAGQVEQSSAMSEKLDTVLVHVDIDEAKTAWDDIF